MIEFIYDNQDTFIDNFVRWHRMNTIEREMYRQSPLQREEALLVFQEFLTAKS